jgi:hypothetical protein
VNLLSTSSSLQLLVFSCLSMWLQPSSLLHIGYIPCYIFPLAPFSLQMPIFHHPIPLLASWVHHLLCWPYNPMRTFASSMDLFHSSLFLDLGLQFLILHLIISACTQSHHLDLGLPLSLLP